MFNIPRNTFYAVCFLLVCLAASAQTRPAAYCPHNDIIVSTRAGAGGVEPEEQRGAVYVYDHETETDQVLSDKGFPVEDIQASPSGEAVAFIEFLPETQVGIPNPRLKILDYDGEVIETFPDIHQYAWSPDGRKIAYQTGPYEEAGKGWFPSDGTFIYDLDSETSRKVYDRGVGLHWAGFDDNLYIWRGHHERVARYVPSMDVIEDTPYSDIHLSPGGEYYYLPSYEGSGFELYLREPNEDVTDDWYFLSIRSNQIYPRGWIGERTLVIPDTRGSSHGDYLFDLEEDIARRASGRIIDYTQDRRGIFVLTPDGIITEEVQELPIVPPEGEELSYIPGPPQAGSLAFRELGSVDLDSPPLRALMSDSGRHFTVEYGSSADHFLAVYTDRDDGLDVRRLPRASGGWVGDDTLVARIPDTGQSVALPADPEYRSWRDAAGNLAAADTLQRFGTAAWAYAEDNAHEILAVDGAPVFDTLQELSETTRQHFISPVNLERLERGTFSRLAAASDVYFVNQDGAPVYQGDRLTHNATELHMVDAYGTVEITLPESGRVQRFAHDGLTQRVLAQTTWSDVILFDGRSEERHFFPRRDPEIYADMEYYLVPDHDYIVTVIKPASKYVDPWLELWSNEGDRLATIPSDAGTGMDIRDVYLSRHILVVVFNRTVYEDRQTTHHPLLRVYGLDPG